MFMVINLLNIVLHSQQKDNSVHDSHNPSEVSTSKCKRFGWCKDAADQCFEMAQGVPATESS